MPNTNVCSTTSFLGKSDAVRHGLTPARRETIGEGLPRRKLQVVRVPVRRLVEKHGPSPINPHYAYERARKAGEVTYSPRR